MNKYTNKWVEFLNGANTIKIGGEKDFISYKSLCKKVGLEPLGESYWDLYELAQNNHCLINYISILVEYQPQKGFTIGYKSVEESEKWYEQKPWTIKEVLQSMK